MGYASLYPSYTATTLNYLNASMHYTLLDDVLVVLVDCSPARGLSLTRRSAENAGAMRVDNVLRKRSGRLKAHQFHLKFEAQLRAFVLCSHSAN